MTPKLFFTTLGNFFTLNMHRIKSSNYFLSSNGCIERFHVILKSLSQWLSYDSNVGFALGLDKILLGIRQTPNATTGETPSKQFFEARVQQKEKSKLRGPHPGNTFITIKNTIYNTNSINVKLDAASAH